MPADRTTTSPSAHPVTPPPPGDLLRALAGKFVVFEGGDGSGKSTQFRRLADACKEAGVQVCEVREPGGTDVGEAIRNVLLAPRGSACDMTVRTEMLLYMASRAQLMEETIRPALARHELVLADRFVSSTHAYQGAGGGLPEAEIRAVAAVAVQGTQPDLVLIFDVDTHTARTRTRGVEPGRGRKKPAGSPTTSLFEDRMESRPQDFQERVRQSYLAQAAAEPARHLVIDARGNAEEVWTNLVASLTARLSAKH